MTLAELAACPDYLLLVGAVQADPSAVPPRMAVADWLTESGFPDLAECWIDRTIRARPAGDFPGGGLSLPPPDGPVEPLSFALTWRGLNSATAVAESPDRRLVFRLSPGRAARNNSGLLDACLIDAHRAAVGLSPLVPSWLAEWGGPPPQS